ncbi:MAG: phenylalanine--tRNA ligase subunit beta, partial [Candidatus Nanoarchaeia archaeon]
MAKRGEDIMPTIEISLRDLEKLVGKKLPTDNRLAEILEYAKAEVEGIDDDTLKINIEDSNRADLWCAEGIARQIKPALGEGGIKRYVIHPSDYRVFVHGKLEKIRGFIACAVVKKVVLNDTIIKQIMQQQEKIDATYGRNRRRTSIGLYNADMLKFPLKYITTKHHENAFVPLGFEEKMNPHEILENHPKGKEYGHLVRGLPEYPIFVDDAGKVLSMPPIINSNDLGQVNVNTENILVEVTGTDYAAVNNVLKIITLTLADRGGEIYEVRIDYPYRKTDITPHLESSLMALNIKEANQLLGTKFDARDIIKLLQKARYGVKLHNPESEIIDHVEVEVPCYRFDVMHPVDICEDIAIANGFSNFESEALAVPTAGKLADVEKLSNKVREFCIGLGAQEILSFNLTNKDNLFRLMGTKEEKVIEIENPVSFTYSCLRNKLLPSVLEFLSKNTTKEYPQKVFEVGDITYPDSEKNEMSTTERRLAFAISKADVTFTDIKQAAEAILANLGKKIAIKEADHDSFIIGRSAVILTGKEKL